MTIDAISLQNFADAITGYGGDLEPPSAFCSRSGLSSRSRTAPSPIRTPWWRSTTLLPAECRSRWASLAALRRYGWTMIKWKPRRHLTDPRARAIRALGHCLASFLLR